MTDNERTLINLRGYCLFCLGKINKGNDPNSPVSSPIGTPSTPLRGRNFIHSLPLEERLAPFPDICRYLDIDFPNCYSFGDGLESEVLSPPLCENCRTLSVKLCVLQDELQYLQMRISNTVKRIYKRITGTCDPRRGALKQASFQKEFNRKSKGSLSRSRANNSEAKKVTHLVRTFHSKVIEKEYAVVTSVRRNTSILPVDCRVAEDPLQHNAVDIDLEILDSSAVKEIVEEACEDKEKNCSSNTQGNMQLSKEENISSNGTEDESLENDDEEERYLPLEETLRSNLVNVTEWDLDLETRQQTEVIKCTRPSYEKSTLAEPLTATDIENQSGNVETGDEEISSDEEDWSRQKVFTRSRTKRKLKYDENEFLN